LEREPLMKAIEQTSLALLAMALFVLALIGAIFALDAYTTQTPLYIPPPESKDFSYVKSVKEATNLEGLKQVCTFWAEHEDQSRSFMKAMHSQFNSLVRDLVATSITLASMFAAGLLYIYITARRLRLGRTSAP
jgi:hypothetical protein